MTNGILSYFSGCFNNFAYGIQLISRQQYIPALATFNVAVVPTSVNAKHPEAIPDRHIDVSTRQLERSAERPIRESELP